MGRVVRVLQDGPALFEAGAQEFARRARAKAGTFSVALSGGSTPRSLYGLLAGEAFRDLPWERIHFFWGDERNVPPDHPDSNFRMAREALLSKVTRIPQANVHPIPATGGDAPAAAAAYETELRSFFHLGSGVWPPFDLVLLGMGGDGHTASLFPGSPALLEQDRLVVSNWVEKFKTHRVTLTLPALNHAACVVFLVAGADKDQILKTVLQEGSGTAHAHPASLIRPEHGELLWLVDGPAGRLLDDVGGRSPS